MKTTLIIFSITLLLSINCLGQDETVLQNKLLILKQLASKTWVGEVKHPSGQMTLHMLVKYEPIYGGKVLKYYKECPKLKYQSDGYFYYDSDKKEIAFLWLSNNGNVTVGNVKDEDGKILMYGYAIFPNRKLEFRNTFEITPDGKLIDKYFRFEDGEWKAGHSVVYNVKQ